MYIYIYTYRSLGVLVRPGNRIRFVRACVRACERSCVWPRDDVASVAGLRKLAACSAVPCPSFAVAKPLPCFMLACESLQIAANRF